MVKVKLSGLKIVRAKGRYYVYRRDTGAKLVNAFEGSRVDLRKRLAMPDMIGAYNAGRKRPKNSTYAEGTLGWLVAWFTNSQGFKKLAEATREGYLEALQYLEPEYDSPLETITQPALYEVRDRCLDEKWPAFADRMVTASSSMFKQAKRRGWMATNPADGIERANKPDKNSNREWTEAEYLTVIKRAPRHLLTAYMIARHAGYRSQSVVAVRWENYQSDPRFGMCLRMGHRKNDEMHWLPAAPVLQAYLETIERTADEIVTRHNGKPWESPEQLQKQSSNFIAKLTKAGLVAPGLTLHGLRVTFAADIRRVTGANDDQIAAALGDRDPRMGRHYTRHVGQEDKLLRLFFSKLGTNRDLENKPKKVFQKQKKRAKTNKIENEGGF